MDIEDLKYIEKKLGRKPNDIEIGMFENLWSEHCSYRSTRNILKLFGKTIKDDQNIVIGPGDDAAVIRIDRETGLCIALAMESHNHPSYIDPYNGAATGVGGIVRDVISMNAKPIALLDSLRFGDIEGEMGDKVRWLVEGVVSGISDYGNRIGVPTVGGECEFHRSYNYNNLVNVVCIGIVREGEVITGKARDPNLSLILVGSTGRDGIGGASFASKDLTSESEEDRPSVQIGDPFVGKCLIDSVLEACKTGKVKAIKDLGAAGLTSACSEMCYGGGVGAEIHLEKVILREEGMTPYEILVSESQERMLLAVERGGEEEVIEIFKKYELPASVIGWTTDTKRIVVKIHGKKIVDLPLDLLCGAPPIERREKLCIFEEYIDSNRVEMPEDLGEVLLKLLGSPNIASKMWIYERYDYEVQLRTVVKPGMDAAVLRFMECPPKALALTTDCNPNFCKLNPYVGSVYTVCEGVRNLATVGAKPIAMLDNLNFGNPEKPERMYQLKKCVEGLANCAEFFNIPIVGGNVSLYNETVIDGKEYPINPTPTICLVGIVDNVEMVPSIYSNVEEGDVIIVTNETKDEMGGSEYFRYIHEIEKGIVPRCNLEREKKIYDTVIDLIGKGLISYATDCSRGGLGVGVARLCIMNKIGAEVYLGDYNKNNLRDDILLFSETSGRILLVVKGENVEEVLNALGKNGYIIGKVGGDALSVYSRDKEIINLGIKEMKDVYEKSFPKIMGDVE